MGKHSSQNESGLSGGGALGLLAGLFLLYYVLYVEPFLTRVYLPGGDTLLTHSVFHSILYSLREFGELPWWDPTMSNGYPLYFQFTAHLFNVFSIHNLIFYGLFSLFGWMAADLNSWVLFYLFVYVPAINGILLYLTARLFVSRVSGVFAVMLYYFSCFTLFNFHDGALVMVMPTALLLLYGGTRYWIRGGENNLLLFGVTLCLYLIGFSYGSLISSAFWLLATAFGFILLNPSRLGETRLEFIELIKRRPVATILLAACLVSACMSPPLLLKENQKVLRYRGGTVKYSPKARVSTKTIEIETSPIQDVALNWIPFSRPTERLKDGHENRYLGIASLLLVILALLCHPKRRWVWGFVVGYAVCNIFIVQTDSVFYQAAIKHISLLQMLRNMKTVFPRGGPSLLLILCSAMGLDAMMILRTKYRGTGNFLLSVAGISGVAFCICFVFFDSQFSSSEMGSNAFHVGLMLCLLAGAIHMVRFSGGRSVAIALLFLFTLIDLISSQSSHLNRGTAATALETHSLGANYRIPYSAALLPRSEKRFAPSASPESHFLPPTVPSEYHNARKPFSGIMEWLVLATHPSHHRLLDNWNYEQMQVTRYPDLVFCTGATRVDSDLLGDEAAISSIIESGPGPYVLVHEDFPEIPSHGNCTNLNLDITEFSFSRLAFNVELPQDGLILYRNNFDRRWNLSVDGQAANLYRANFTYTAFPIKAGHHSAALAFYPMPVIRIYRLSYLLLASALVWLAGAYLRSKARDKWFLTRLSGATFWGKCEG